MGKYNLIICNDIVSKSQALDFKEAIAFRITPGSTTCNLKSNIW